MDIRLHSDSKKVSNLGTVLLAVSLVPLLIMAITGDVPWVWGTVGLFVLAVILILGERSRNERNALHVGRHNAAVVTEKYKVDMSTAEGYRLIKGLKDDGKDVEGEVVRKDGAGVRLVRKDGEYTLRNVSGGEEYDRDRAKAKVEAEEEAGSSDLSEYAQSLYESAQRSSLPVPTDEFTEAVQKVREANLERQRALHSDAD